MTIKPLNNNVLIEVEEQKVTKSGIILTQENVVTERATVVSSGASDLVKKGDVIYYKSYALSPIEIGDKKYFFIKEEDILATEG